MNDPLPMQRVIHLLESAPQQAIYSLTSTHMSYLCTNIKIDRKKDSEVTVTAEISAEAMKSFRTRAIERIGTTVKLDGFRSGHIPEEVLIKNIGESAIMQEAAELAITDQYPQLVEKEKLPIIGRPNISISKLTKDEAMTFTINATLLPEVTLPDYKAIAKKHTGALKEATVTDDEVTDTLTHLRRERAKIERIEKGMSADDANKEVATLETSALPLIDDTFTKTLGYESAELFTTKLKENIKTEKGNRDREKTRISLIEDIIKATNPTIPQLLVDAELSNMESQFAHDLAHNGTNLDDYLKETKKTKEQLHDEWREGAKKRAAMQLITREIALKENITPDMNQVASEVEHIISHTKNADLDSVQSYVTNALRTEMVFRFLEEQK